MDEHSVSYLSQLYRHYCSLMDAAVAVRHPLERVYLIRRANLMLVRYIDEVDRLAEEQIQRGTGVFLAR